MQEGNQADTLNSWVTLERPWSVGTAAGTGSTFACGDWSGHAKVVGTSSIWRGAAE